VARMEEIHERMESMGAKQQTVRHYSASGAKPRLMLDGSVSGDA